MTNLEQLVQFNISEALNPSLAILAAFLVVPGFIAMKTYDLTVASERRNFGNSLIEVFSFSLVNLVIWSWVPLTLDLRTFPENYPIVTYLGALFIILISPVVLSTVFRKLLDQQIFGFLSPEPTGWDGFFSKGKSGWILCHLKDEEQTAIGGYFGRSSVASSHPNKQQVYIEAMYEIDQEDYSFGERVEQTQGAIISAEDCYFVELFEEELDGSEEDRGTHAKAEGLYPYLKFGTGHAPERRKRGEA